MGPEGNSDDSCVWFGGLGGTDDLDMTAMHAVEIADDHYRGLAHPTIFPSHRARTVNQTATRVMDHAATRWIRQVGPGRVKMRGAPQHLRSRGERSEAYH